MSFPVPVGHHDTGAGGNSMTSTGRQEVGRNRNFTPGRFISMPVTYKPRGFSISPYDRTDGISIGRGEFVDIFA